MTKQEAINAMQEGKKVTHRYFTSDEWMTMVGGDIMTEEGYKVPPKEFWQYRTDEFWNDGFELFEPPNTKHP